MTTLFLRAPAAILLASVAALAACSGASKIERFQISTPAPAQTVPNRIGSAELRDVSLPTYAADQEIAYQTPDGAVRTDPKKIWADNPQRAITLALATQISAVSGAQVIAEPWPLSNQPARRIDVRVEQLLAGADGNLTLAGSYYVSPQMGEGGDVARRFRVLQPIGDAPGAAEDPAAIARAVSAAVTTLAAQIAALR